MSFVVLVVVFVVEGDMIVEDSIAVVGHVFVEEGMIVEGIAVRGIAVPGIVVRGMVVQVEEMNLILVEMGTTVESVFVAGFAVEVGLST